jgi:hypothetical protein
VKVFTGTKIQGEKREKGNKKQRERREKTQITREFFL